MAIDTGCATVAEVRKRGDEFWNEFDFYLSDLIVGCVLDVVLVTLLAPVAVIGKHSRAAKATGLLSCHAPFPVCIACLAKCGVCRHAALFISTDAASA